MERRLSLPAGEIGLYESGEGEPILYLHSVVGETGPVPFLEGLAGAGRLIAPCLPGFGTSDQLDAVESVEDLVIDVLRELLEALEVDSCTVVGTCFGGWLAAELATRYPEMVERMVLINPLGLYLPGHEMAEIFGLKPGDFAALMVSDPDTDPWADPYREMQGWFDQGKTPPFELIEPHLRLMAAAARYGYSPYFHNAKLRRRLGRVTSEVLVVYGTSDRFLPGEHARTYGRELPSARVASIAGGHLLPLESPDALLALVTEFLNLPTLLGTNP